jgi:hypothetical protein
MAFTTVDLPWATWPMVPMLMVACGLICGREVEGGGGGRRRRAQRGQKRGARWGVGFPSGELITRERGQAGQGRTGSGRGGRGGGG